MIKYLYECFCFTLVLLISPTKSIEMSISLLSIANGEKLVPIHQLNTEPDKTAAKEIQTILCDLGILDPGFSGSASTPFGPTEKADGVLGLNSRNALFTFSKLRDIPYLDTSISPVLARELLLATPDTVLPMHTKIRSVDSKQTILAKKLVIYMQRKGYWIARHPEMVNIIYSEGMDPDGKENKDAQNKWNDRRMAFRIKPNGNPQMLLNHDATTEPGSYYVQHPLNPSGAARVAFGQYKAWVDGLHKGVQPALVQSGPIRVHRDKNKDGKRSPTDPMEIGSTFGINQHSTSAGYQSTDIDKYSAGCLVSRNYADHVKFLARVRKDKRYALNKSYMFITTVIAGDDFDRTT